MTRATAVYAALAASLLASACDPASPTDAATGPAVAAARAPQLTSFTFTKIPAAQTVQAITSPATGFETILYQMDALGAEGLVVKQFGFMISGSLQAGDVGHYQLVYFPDGLKKPGVVMGTNEGTNWVAPGGSPSSFINIDLATPITIPKGKSFTAYFALRADVTGTGTFFFYPSVQTCLVNNAGIDQDVTWFGGDLPLRGNQFNVN